MVTVKIALITGASQGLGFETAKLLAASGPHVSNLELRFSADRLEQRCNMVI